jgi:hypothetical protein
VTSEFRQLARKSVARQRRRQVLLASGGLALVIAMVAVAAFLLGRQFATGKPAEAAPGAVAVAQQPGEKTPERGEPDASSLAAIEDGSLPNDRYVELGFPAYDRRWDGPDMAEAAARLRALAAQHPEQLPRFENPKSGQMFARLVDPENLKFVQSSEFTFDVRLPLLLGYLKSLIAIDHTYASAAAAKKVGGDDVVEILAAGLKAAQCVIDLSDQWPATFSHDAARRGLRTEALNWSRVDLAEIAEAGITSLVDEQNLTVTARSRVAAELCQTLPSLLPKLTAASQVKIARRLEKLAVDPRQQALRGQMYQLRNVARGVVPATSVTTSTESPPLEPTVLPPSEPIVP